MVKLQQQLSMPTGSMFKINLKTARAVFFVCQNSNHLFSLELTKQNKKINIYFVNLNLN